MSTLFEPVKLGTLTLRNRFVRSATWEAMATPAGVKRRSAARRLSCVR